MNSHGVRQRLTDITMAMDCQKETGKEPFSLNNKHIFFYDYYSLHEHRLSHTYFNIIMKTTLRHAYNTIQ